MRYKDKIDGHEIRAVQYHSKLKEEYNSFLGNDGYVEDIAYRLWIKIKGIGTMCLCPSSWLVKDDALDERFSMNGYTILQDKEFRDRYILWRH